MNMFTNIQGHKSPGATGGGGMGGGAKRLQTTQSLCFSIGIMEKNIP